MYEEDDEKGSLMVEILYYARDFFFYCRTVYAVLLS